MMVGELEMVVPPMQTPCHLSHVVSIVPLNSDVVIPRSRQLLINQRRSLMHAHLAIQLLGGERLLPLIQLPVIRVIAYCRFQQVLIRKLLGQKLDLSAVVNCKSLPKIIFVQPIRTDKPSAYDLSFFLLVMISLPAEGTI